MDPGRQDGLGRACCADYALQHRIEKCRISKTIVFLQGFGRQGCLGTSLLSGSRCIMHSPPVLYTQHSGFGVGVFMQSRRRSPAKVWCRTTLSKPKCVRTTLPSPQVLYVQHSGFGVEGFAQSRKHSQGGEEVWGGQPTLPTSVSKCLQAEVRGGDS